MEHTTTPRRTARPFALTAIAMAVSSSFTMGLAYAQAPEPEAAQAEEQAAPESEAPAETREAAAPEQVPDDGIETIYVTGSRIQRKRTDTETPSAVQLLSREQIENSGKPNIAEVIRGLSIDNQGSIPNAFTGGFATGSSGVSLRGLGVNSTLVLINGRRAAPYGLADDGSRTFVDLNTIPLDAVERIEVLKDGASALYGSDAVGGVINVILREQYKGGNVGVHYGTSYRADGTDQGISGTYGIGDLKDQGYNAFVSIEASGVDSIMQSTRPDYLGTNDLRKYGWYDNRLGANGAGFGTTDGVTPFFSRNSPYGYVGAVGAGQNLTPCPEVSDVTGACVYDTIGFDQIQPEQKRLNIYGRGTLALAESAQLYLEGGFFKTTTEYISAPGSFNFGNTYNPADPANPVFPAAGPILPADHPDNPTGTDIRLRYLSAETGGRNGRVENEVTRVLGGIKGSFADWSYDLGVLYTESVLDQTQTGFPQFSVLQARLDDGSFRINNPLATPQSVYDEIFPALKTHSTAELSLIDGHVSGAIFELPGGPLSLALGSEFRNEKAHTPAVPGTDTGEVGGLGYSAFKSDRDVYAFYAEIDAPVVPMLDLTAALRYDHYSDFGNSTTPKAGFKFKPFKGLALRGTYSEAFRAPGPTESGESASLGFTNIAIVSVGSSTVKPEEAKSYTLGFVAEPFDSTSLTFDYYHIKRTNEIIQADQTLVIGDNPTSGGTPNGQIEGDQPGSFIYYDADGNISAISAPYINANKTVSEGFDADLSHKLKFGDWGQVTAGLTLTHIISLRRETADGVEYEYAGTHGPYVLSSAGGTPKDRATITLQWDYRNWSTTASINYVGPMTMIDHENEELIESGDGGQYATTTFEAAGFGYLVSPGEPVCGVYDPRGKAPNGCELSSFTTLDLSAKYISTDNWVLSASVLNALNRLAPFDPYTYGGTNYNPAFHQAGAVGRFYTVALRYTFGQ